MLDRLKKEVTLCSVLGNDKYLEQTIKAAEYSIKDVDIDNVQILCPVSFNHPKIKHVEIPEHDYDGYNLFMMQELHKHFNTPHVLIFQFDGFIINANSWEDQFLDYDYVGAPWPVNYFDNVPILSYNRVGNSGFSLRSKKFTEATINCPTEGHNGEDVLFCRIHRNYMEKEGIKFAPIDVAARFSVELTNMKEQEGQNQNDRFSLTRFGFHGKFSDACRFID